MTVRLRITRLLLTALCVCPVVSACPLAYSQDAPATAEREQSATQEQQQPASDRAPAIRDERVEEAWEFSDLIGSIGWEERRNQDRIQKGKPPYPETNWCKMPRIQEKEAQTMCSILLEAFHQVEEIDRQSAEINHEIHRQYIHNHRHFDDELVTKRTALDIQRTQVYEEAVLQLNESLGEDTFQKVKAWILSRVPAQRQSRRDFVQDSAPAAQMPPRPKTE